MRKHLGVIAIVVIALIGIYFIGHRGSPAPTAKPQHTITRQSPSVAHAPTAPVFDKKQYSLSDPASPWVVVNKQRPLQPKEYAPTDLVTPGIPLRLSANDSEMHVRAATAKALEQLFAAAAAQGQKLMLASGYRSYTEQVAVYGAEVKNYGQAVADSESARPGYSEHQTGLAADLEPASRHCEVGNCFADTPEGQWLAANAYKYGFILRYPSDAAAAITGYRYEPWHVRYVGTALAEEMHREHVLTLEEFFGLPAAPNY